MDSKRTILSRGETTKVIEVWRNYIEELRGARRNIGVLQKMCKQLELHHSIKLSPMELRTRINNLTKKFRSERKRMELSGDSVSDWEHFMDINSFIGHSKSNRIDDFIIIELDPLEGNDGCNQLSQDQEDTAKFSPGLNCIGTELSSSSCSIPSTSVAATELSQKVTRKKRKYSGSDKLLELAKEESLQFKKFCDECIKNDRKKIELLQENNAIQKQLLNAILEKKI